MMPQMPVQPPMMQYPMWPGMSGGMMVAQQSPQDTPRKYKDKDDDADSSSESDSDEECKGMTNAKWTGGTSS